MPIVLEDVTYVYSPGTPFETVALAHVSLIVSEGVFLGIVGKTGSGKSTLIQMMNGLLTPTTGRVLVDDIEITSRRSDKKSIRSKVGLVFQYPEYQLFEETLYEDVAFGPRCLGVSEDEIKSRVEDSCSLVGLPIERYGLRSPFELSGGEMRRAAIAGVLAMRPKYLVMDEPTAGLDPSGRNEMLFLLQRLHHEGITICMISHSMEEVASIADSVAVMGSGAIAGVGEVKTLFTNSRILEDSGLEPPSTIKLIKRLQDRGIPVEISGSSVDAVANSIAEALSRGGVKDI